MKTDLLAQTTDDAGVSDTTSEYSLLSSESPDGENMEKLREKIINQNEKIKLYEATIRDKNDLIKTLNISIEFMKENKELAIKQFKNEIADLQKALDLRKSPTLNKDDANAEDSAEFEKKPTENADFLTLQKQFEDNMCQLKSTNFELKSKLDENIKKMSTLEAKIAELEKNAKIYKVKSEEKDTKLVKGDSNDTNSQVTDAPFVFLSHSKVPNIKLIKIGDEEVSAIVENIPAAGPDWIVLLHRFDGSVCFLSKCLDKSVGYLFGEFWIGLESIHKLTASTRHELYIQLEDFDGVTAYARYDNFVVGNSKEEYTLKSLGAYSGNAGDALRSHVKSKINYKIFKDFYCYWWFSNNNKCCLTGEYKKSKEPLENDQGMYWGNWYLGKCYPLKACKMLIRPYSK